MAEGAWLAEAVAGWTCTWGEYLQDSDGAELASAMRQREHTGRPLGERPFVERIGELLGRNLMPKKRGPKLVGCVAELRTLRRLMRPRR